MLAHHCHNLHYQFIGALAFFYILAFRSLKEVVIAFRRRKSVTMFPMELGFYEISCKSCGNTQTLQIHFEMMKILH